MIDKSFQIVGVVGDVLTGMIAMLFDEAGDLGFLGAINAFDQRNTEITVVDAPDLHAAVRIAGTRVIDALDQGSALYLDVEPGPFFDAASLNRIGNVINLLEMRHCVLQPNR